MNSIIKRAGAMLVSMVLASSVAGAMRPTKYLADEGPRLNLEAMVPAQFGDWHVEPETVASIVNPEVKGNLDRLYTQILSRTYANSAGYRIMLMIAYGREQHKATLVHYPEVCYPAQGFRVLSNTMAEIGTVQGPVQVRRLETALESRRVEPVTYWMTVGKFSTLGGLSRKMIEINYGFRQEIPDGLLFRVSSIDKESDAAFSVQAAFISALIKTLTPDQRNRLVGIVSN